MNALGGIRGELLGDSYLDWRCPLMGSVVSKDNEHLVIGLVQEYSVVGLLEP